MLVCGVLAAACYAPLKLWPLALVLLIPMITLAQCLEPRRAFMCGYLYGMALVLSGLYWISVVMTTYGRVNLGLAVFIMLLAALYGGLFFASFTWLISWWKGPRWALLILAPLFWAGNEYLRAILLFGFPWCPFGQVLAAYPPMAQTAEFWSAPGLSAMVVLINMLLAWALIPGEPRWSNKTRIAYALVAVGILAAAWGWGSMRMAEVGRAMAAAPKITTTVVQANIALPVLHDRSKMAQVVGRAVTLTEQEAKKISTRPWLVVWPETAAPFYFAYQKQRSQGIIDLVDRLNMHLTLGSTGVKRSGDRSYSTNRSWLVTPELGLSFYDKVHLVPFGEYVPFPSVFFFVRAIANVGMDMLPGKAGITLKAGPAVLGPLICYESVFPYLARAQANAGANLLINQTNDAWFGRTSAPYQHISHMALRCIETRLAGARAANTGISGFVLPDGRIVDTTGIFEPGVRTRALPLMKMETFFTRHGDYLGPGGLIVGCLVGLWGWLRRRMKKEG